MSADLLKKVAATGFQCKRCGKCCGGEFGDNTVTIFPSEIRSIMEATGLEWLDIARPHESDDVDEQGLYHTFEWALRKKKNSDCMFLEGGKCTVYEHRPLICRTYPMKLETGHLELFECEGIGSGAMDEPEARRMAEELLRRQIVENMETISLLEKYEAFHPARRASEQDRVYVVHDSEGSRKVLARKDGSCSFV